jgi:hypothetical protein
VQTDGMHVFDTPASATAGRDPLLQPPARTAAAKRAHVA